MVLWYDTMWSENLHIFADTHNGNLGHGAEPRLCFLIIIIGCQLFSSDGAAYGALRSNPEQTETIWQKNDSVG